MTFVLLSMHCIHVHTSKAKFKLLQGIIAYVKVNAVHI